MNPTDLDRTLNFTIPQRHARGRIARLGPVLGEILAAHAYPAPIERLLAEAPDVADQVVRRWIGAAVRYASA